MGSYINIRLQGAVYFAARRSGDDDELLQLYSNTLVGIAQESTFDTLYSRLAREWRQHDDIVLPFHDRRGRNIAVWIFDLDSDILRLNKIDCNLRVPLSLVSQRPITISDLEPYEASTTVAKHAVQSIYRTPCWKITRKEIDLPSLQRRKAFISRILEDFSFQWRHVLGGHYNNLTFRRLAYAIIRLVTLDFTIKEVTHSRQGMGGFLVWTHSLPEWNFASEHIVKVGGTSIVICQHAPHAVSLIRDDFAKQVLSTPKREYETFTYLILSVRELILYRINSERERYTEPARLFNGTQPPSSQAIDLLLQATQTSSPSPLRKLPVELQDAILDKVSAGPVESASVGCLLKAEGHPTRPSGIPVESQSWFGSHHSGIAYK
ncbi:hypothetical protein K491DRAFT_766956 [Lophiostoma macrostomum CBS 122681]|uniref:Uncharacterized protein n=1 Tax=Lophiostoma macrostomum CBS 122681 TaxID=1314788 RepID=A0A6A6TFY9_9PLEO|nr:hypothetical protein K491DRAFT_766956 [Lophiostoma macrostomum CBS 122681]